jgi:hypothetical protein
MGRKRRCHADEGSRLSNQSLGATRQLKITLWSRAPDQVDQAAYIKASGNFS